VKTNFFPSILALGAVTISVMSCNAEEKDKAPAIDEAALEAASQERDLDKIIELTADAEKGSQYESLRGRAFQARGVANFYDAKIKESIADFDAYLAIVPEEDPHHWQRGLSYYYAGEYEKGVAQFERHQTVNSQDVENAVWHFICAVRAPKGTVEKARKDFIDIEKDSRVPMAEIHMLFEGTGSEEAVMKSANSGTPENSEARKNHLCYAHLYLGLYFEALGKDEKAKEHMVKAAVDYKMDHYMGMTAQVHAKVRGWVK